MKRKYKWQQKRFIEKIYKKRNEWFDHLQIKKIKLTESKNQKNHRIAEIIDEYTMILNDNRTHLGMTSSDLVDNCRILWLREEEGKIREQFFGVVKELSRLIEKNKGIPIVGRTHLKIATLTTIGYRFAPTFEVLLGLLKGKLRLQAKGIGGSVGTGSADREIGGKERFDEVFLAPTQFAKNQTSNMMGELNFIIWISTISANLHKICLDIRLMVGLNEMKIENNGVGSTAMPHKGTNPWRFEKACSLFRMIPKNIQIIYDDIMMNMLERSLDNQTNLQICLEEAITHFKDGMIEMEKGLDVLEINQKQIKKDIKNNRGDIMSEIKLTRLIKNGENRDKARHIVISDKGTGFPLKTIIGDAEIKTIILIEDFKRLEKLIIKKSNEYEK